ncbi:hypothetical protein LG293_16295 (plasmid) [Citricoccus nitrophenolicus]
MTNSTVEWELLEGEETEDLQDTPGRHANLERVCGLLEAILHGRAAERLLESGIGPGMHRMLVFPAWDWRKPAMEIGRKAVDRATGQTLLMPVRLDWGGNDNLVRLVKHDGVSDAANWHAQSMGWSDTGSVNVSDFQSWSRTSKNGSTLINGPESLSESVRSAVTTRADTEAALRSLSIAGSDAMWQLVLGLEQFVGSTVRKAHAAVSHDISRLTGKVQPVLHETGVEQVVNKMMFGAPEDGQTESAPVMRMVELCLRPNCFAKVDPLRYLHINLRRDAEEEIRKSIGDPRIGSKIRRLAVTMKGASLGQLVEEYRREYPADKLSLRRAQAALSVNSDPMARSVMLDPETNRRSA